MINSATFDFTRKIYDKNTQKVTNPLKTKTSIDQKDTKVKVDPQLLQSYFVSFKGSPSKVNKELFEDLSALFTPSADRLWEQAESIAKKHGDSEVSYPHLFKACLQDVKEFIGDIDSGEIALTRDNSSSITYQFEEEIDPEIIKDKNKRKKLKDIINAEIENIDKKLDKDTKAPTAKMGQPPIAKRLLSDIHGIYNSDSAMEEMETMPINQDLLFRSVLFPDDKDVSRTLSQPFMTKLQKAFMEDDVPITQKPHIRFFDNKAKDIWKNLDLGNNMFSIYDEKEAKPQYLVNSFVNLMETKDSLNLNNLKKENTDIILLKKNTSLDYLEKIIEKSKKDPKKNTVFVVDYKELSKNTPGLASDENSIFKEVPSNIKFLLLSPKDLYFSEQEQNSIFKETFKDFGVLPLPILSPDEAKKVIKQEPVLTKN